MKPLPDESGKQLVSELEFARLLADLRPALRGYVLSVLPHPDAAEDVVQETSVFLWERRGDFDAGTNFKAWAFKTAYFKALSHRRDLQREKVVTLSEDLIQRVAGAAQEVAEEADVRLRALGECLAGLRPRDLQLLQLRYVEQRSLTDQAKALQVPPNRLQKAISRLRLALRHCIETKVRDTP